MNSIKATLLAAAKVDDVATLRAVVHAEGADKLNISEDPNELTLLHYASAAGSDQVVRYLITSEVAADVNAARGNNFTPLHAAAMNGATAICVLLLLRGAKPEFRHSLRVTHHFTVPRGVVIARL